MEVKIKELSENAGLNICLVPNDIFTGFKLSKEIPYKFHLGQSHEYAYIAPNPHHDECMYFSNSVFKKLLLFEGITLNIWINGDEIFLGPVVGIFVSSKCIKAIRNGRPSFFILKHAEAGSKTNCLSYYYSLEGINWDEKKINGYTFDRILHKWRCGWFPLPDVVYYRGPTFDEYQKFHGWYMIDQFKENNVQYINSQTRLNKWIVHKRLSKYPDASVYLPRTIIYGSFNDVLSMLKEFRFIFIKATNGTQGKQVLSIEQIDDGYILNFNKHGLNEVLFKEVEDIKIFVENFTKGRPFLIQQGIRLIKYDGRNMDLRMLMMKNRRGDWEAMQHHCRIAKKTYTITNCFLGGDWINYEEVYPCLKSTFCEVNIPDLEELVNAAKKVLYYFEKEFGPYGEIGMDMAIDIYGHIWFIEANRRPGRLTRPSLYDPNEIPVQAVNIFEYAIFLAGTDDQFKRTPKQLRSS